MGNLHRTSFIIISPLLNVPHILGLENKIDNTEISNMDIWKIGIKLNQRRPRELTLAADLFILYDEIPGHLFYHWDESIEMILRSLSSNNIYLRARLALAFWKEELSFGAPSGELALRQQKHNWTHPSILLISRDRATRPFNHAHMTTKTPQNATSR